VVYAGSSSAYGETPTLPKVESMARAPLSPYAVSKLAGEHYCPGLRAGVRCRAGGPPILQSVRPRQDPNSQYAAVIPRFVTAALEETPGR
jgi:nucleoside-diphosphate-sugar epimerase